MATWEKPLELPQCIARKRMQAQLLKRRSTLLTVTLLHLFRLVAATLVAGSLIHAQSPVIIDTGRQLFVDDALIAETTLTREWHAAKKFEGNPVLRPETPLELQGGRFPVAAPFSDGVFFDPNDGLFKLWYHAGWFDGTALATSRDGLHWERPSFDVVPGTNRVIPDHQGWRRDGCTVWLDHTAGNPAERFKMFLFTRDGELFGPLKGGVGRILASPDGVHWTERGITGSCGDNTGFFHDPFRQKWVFSIRSHGKETPRHGRMRSYWSCDDFIASPKWREGEPRPWAFTDELDVAEPGLNQVPQLYKLNATPYESLLLGLFDIFYGPPNKEAGASGVPKVIDLQVGFSRDGFTWHRPHRKAFIASARQPGAWDRGYLCSVGGGCLVVGDELWFYYGAFRGSEKEKGSDTFWSGMYANGATGLARLRRDGFASMNANEKGGTLTTVPVAFRGRFPFVNIACNHGELRAEILDDGGRVISPFTLENAIPVKADSARQRLEWKGAEDLSSLVGRPVKFRFHLTSGQIYAFWVSQKANGTSNGYAAAGGPGLKNGRDE